MNTQLVERSIYLISIKVLEEMNYQEKLEKAQNFVSEGKHLQAAKIFEEVGTKNLREGGDAEKKVAPKIIGKSIARYMLAGNITKAQDLAFQVMPNLSLTKSEM